MGDGGMRLAGLPGHLKEIEVGPMHGILSQHAQLRWCTVPCICCDSSSVRPVALPAPRAPPPPRPGNCVLSASLCTRSLQYHCVGEALLVAACAPPVWLSVLPPVPGLCI